jgi:hemoglobin
MPDPDRYTEADVTALVHTFYDRIRADEVLGPIFNQHIHDWDAHLAHLVDFWSGLLRGTSRFRGSPVTKHAALPNLSWSLFQRWLHVFQQTTTALNNPALKADADAMSQRIAATLWHRYEHLREPTPASAADKQHTPA